MRGLTLITETEYLSTTTDVVISVTAPGSPPRVTAFTYDHRGRRKAVDAPDTFDADGATLANINTTAYNPDGTVKETDGAQTYRTTHTYDYAQRMVTLTTYGTETAVTEWKYSPDRGFLTEKNHHGETSNDPGNATDYTYTAAGRILTRTWERGITTTYTHDPAGRLTITDHSDTTPDVLITYDTLSRPQAVKNGEGAYVSGAFTIATPLFSNTFTYDPGTLDTDTETVSHDIDLNGTPELTRVIDRSRDSLGRSTGWELKNGATVENSVQYDYSLSDGRISEISNPQISNSFTYGYEPNSYGLIKTVTGPVHTVTNLYEGNRDVLTSKQNEAGAFTRSSFTYGVNEIGQRTDLTIAFDLGGSGLLSNPGDTDWGYNSKGEVVKADHTIPGLDRAYVFDGIGNRLKAAEGTTDPDDPLASLYTPNALNQYTAVDTFNPTHDADGNQINAQVLPLGSSSLESCVFSWDAENRLISATVNGQTTNYRYDAQSRRIATVTPTGTATITIYDGWNPIAEYSGNVGVSPTLTKTNLWGIDLSGSIQGAGGVGGLLAVTDNTGTYYPTFDGNGNVSEYLNSTGTVVAHYEYDPSGRTTVATGSKANDFSHRFSTKPLDSATGLYYYGYRYYDPVTGRWPSRDPIWENGGVNLYGFVGNDGVNGLDVVGLSVLMPTGDLMVYMMDLIGGKGSKSQACCTNPDPINLSFAFDWSPRTRPLDTAHKADELNWFKRVAKSKDTSGKTANHQESGVTGKDLLNAMYNASKNCHCIQTLTTAGHGGGAGSQLDYVESPKWKKMPDFMCILNPLQRQMVVRMNDTTMIHVHLRI